LLNTTRSEIATDLPPSANAVCERNAYPGKILGTDSHFSDPFMVFFLLPISVFGALLAINNARE